MYNLNIEQQVCVEYEWSYTVVSSLHCKRFRSLILKLTLKTKEYILLSHKLHKNDIKWYITDKKIEGGLY